MTMPTVNSALQFIHTAGIPGFLSGIQTSMIPPNQIHTGFCAIGNALDTYEQAVPHDKDLSGLKSLIAESLSQQGASSSFSGNLLDQLTEHSQQVERAVRLAAGIYRVSLATIVNGVAVANVPMDLGDEWSWILSVFQPVSQRRTFPPEIGSDIYMGRHLVTNRDLREFLQSTDAEDLRDIPADDQPAVYVGIDQAVKYSRWLGEKVSREMGVSVSGDLPTEGEWIRAAIGPSGNDYNGYGLGDIGRVQELTRSFTSEQNFPTDYVIVCGGLGFGNTNPSGSITEIPQSSIDKFSKGSHNIGFRTVLRPQ